MSIFNSVFIILNSQLTTKISSSLYWLFNSLCLSSILAFSTTASVSFHCKMAQSTPLIHHLLLPLPPHLRLFPPLPIFLLSLFVLPTTTISSLTTSLKLLVSFFSTSLIIITKIIIIRMVVIIIIVVIILILGYFIIPNYYYCFCY